MTVNSKEERVFEYYSHMPAELRMMVVDEMEVDDRCRFRRCSKLSSKEATSSKKFSYSLQLELREFTPSYLVRRSGFERKMIIKVAHGKTRRNETCGYMLYFMQESGKNVMKYLRLNTDQELWSIEICQHLDGFENLVDFATSNFKNLLKTHQKTIKGLHLHSNTLSMNNFYSEINSLDNLEHVTIQFEINIIEFLSKLRRPLKTLAYWDIKPFPTCQQSHEQMYQVSDKLKMPSLHLNYQQFLRLSAKSIEIKIGDISVSDIFDFIKSWKNGEIRENLEWCEWGLFGSTFDVEQLRGSLENVEIDEDEDDDEDSWKSTIKDKNGKCAELCYHSFGDALFIDFDNELY